MDPLSILSLVEACSSISIALGKVIVALNRIAKQYKQVELTMKVLANECKTTAVVTKNLQDWIKSQDDAASIDKQIWDQLRESLELCNLVVAAFEEDLRPISDTPALIGFRRRAKATWALQTLKEHENRVRGQFGGLTLLLQIVSL